MARISDARKVERLNHAWRLLQHGGDLSEAAERMARDCAISARQAYRYLEQARSLKAPVVVGDEKVAFTVKLRRDLVAAAKANAISCGASTSSKRLPTSLSTTSATTYRHCGV